MGRFEIPTRSYFGLTDRARQTEVLAERLSRCDSSQWTGGATVVRERLNVNIALAVVLNDGLLDKDAGS